MSKLFPSSLFLFCSSIMNQTTPNCFLDSRFENPKQKGNQHQKYKNQRNKEGHRVILFPPVIFFLILRGRVGLGWKLFLGAGIFIPINSPYHIFLGENVTGYMMHLMHVICSRNRDLASIFPVAPYNHFLIYTSYLARAFKTNYTYSPSIDKIRILTPILCSTVPYRAMEVFSSQPRPVVASFLFRVYECCW